MTVVVPVLIGILYICASSLIPEPDRRRFNAVMVAGAGAAYLSGGGLGPGEFAFTAVLTYVAFRGWSRGRSSGSAGCCTPRGTWSTITGVVARLRDRSDGFVPVTGEPTRGPAPAV